MPDPFTAPEEVIPALELVLEHARGYVAELDGPVRAPGADEAARSFAGSLPEEGNGTLAAVRQLLERGTEAHVRSRRSAILPLGDRRLDARCAGGGLVRDPDRPERGLVGREPARGAAGGDLPRLAPGAVRLARCLGRRVDDRRDNRQLHGTRGGTSMVGPAAGRRRGRAGPGRAPPVPVLTSGFVHVASLKALAMLGVGRDQVTYARPIGPAGSTSQASSAS